MGNICTARTAVRTKHKLGRIRLEDKQEGRGKRPLAHTRISGHPTSSVAGDEYLYSAE